MPNILDRAWKWWAIDYRSRHELLFWILTTLFSVIIIFSIAILFILAIFGIDKLRKKKSTTKPPQQIMITQTIIPKQTIIPPVVEKIIPVKDPNFGKVAAAYIQTNKPKQQDEIVHILKDKIEKFKIPKYFHIEYLSNMKNFSKTEVQTIKDLFSKRGLDVN